MVTMAVREYVGARYVPKFADPVEWQANTAYEALTIVTYNNSSYTSKIPVPASVGNPAQNNQYWACTGNYNQQVEDYRQTSLQLQENLNEEIKNREEADTTLTNTVNNNHGKYTNAKVICIGDSYGTGYYDGSDHKDTTSWPAVLKTITGMNVINYSYGGAGFVGNQPSHTFLNQLQEAVSDGNTDAQIILIGGGANDAPIDQTTVLNAATTCINYAKQNFPNAKIYILWLPVFYTSVLDKKFICETTYQNLALTYGLTFKNIAIYARFKANTLAGDNLHLNANGYNIEANEIASLLFTGTCTTYNINLSGENYILIYGTPESLSINKYQVTAQGPQGTTDSQYICDGTADILTLDLATTGYENLWMLGTKYLLGTASGSFGVSDGSTMSFVPCTFNLYINNNKLHIQVQALNDNGTGYKVVSEGTVYQCNINQFSMHALGNIFC